MGTKQKYCDGCRNNFYNGNNGLGVKKCWSLKDAKIVWRWMVGWWCSPPSGPKVRTLDCWHAPGKFAMYRDEPPGNKLAKQATSAKELQP